MRDNFHTRMGNPKKMVGNSALLLRPAFGGGAAGAMHAITGPDHLTGLLAPCANKGFSGGALIGAMWGLGHAVSTVILGMLFFFLKNQMSTYSKLFDSVNKYSSVFVGANLVLIGLFGMYEAFGSSDDKVSADRAAQSKATAVPYGLIFGNGLLHGFSIDGAVSLAPSLTLNSWPFALTFLVSYAFSTAVVISAAAGAISAGVSKLDNLLDSNVPKQLAYYSSILSVVIGTLWSLYSVINLMKNGEFGFS
jgi:hypothetical protein